MPPDRRRKIETATTKNSDQHKSDRDTARRLNIHAKSQKIFVLQLKVCMPDLLRLKPKTERKESYARRKNGKENQIKKAALPRRKQKPEGVATTFAGTAT
jgi:hypothetical protein